MFRYLALAVLGSLVVSACGGAAPVSTAPPTQAAPASKPATAPPAPVDLLVGLHWSYHVADWAGNVIADKRGYYKDAGLNVTWDFVGGSNPVVQAVGAGKEQIGLAAPDAILAGMAKSLPITIVANHLQQSPAGVLAPASANIHGFADLKGKTISTAAASPELAMLTVALKSAGLDVNGDVKINLVDPQAKCTVVLAGQMDVCTGQNNFHAQQFEAKGIAYTFLPFSTTSAPVPGASVVVNSTFLQSNPDAMKRFLQATYRGWSDFLKMTDDDIVGLYRADRPETDVANLKSTLAATRSLVFSARTDSQGWGWMDDSTFKALNDDMAGAQLISAPVPLNKVYTDDYLPNERTFKQPS